MKKGTDVLEVTLTLRGDPAGVVNAFANGLPLEALVAIRDGMAAELHKQLGTRRKRKAAPRVAIKVKR